jgi:hypothetical protein
MKDKLSIGILSFFSFFVTFLLFTGIASHGLSENPSLWLVPVLSGLGVAAVTCWILISDN